MKTKSNADVYVVKDIKKSYVYVYDGEKMIGVLMWDYRKKKWKFEE